MSERTPEERFGLVAVSETPGGVRFRLRWEIGRIFRLLGVAAVLVGGVWAALAAGARPAPGVGFFTFLFGAIFYLIGGLVGALQRVGEGIVTPVYRALEVRRAPAGGGYRDAAPPAELLVDGRALPVSAARSVEVGHQLVRTKHGTQDVFPVYVVLDREVVVLANLNGAEVAGRLARRIGQALGSEVRVLASPRREAAPLSTGGQVFLLVVLLLVGIGAALGGAFGMLFAPPSARAFIALGAVAFIAVFERSLFAILRRTSRGAIERWAHERFGI